MCTLKLVNTSICIDSYYKQTRSGAFQRPIVLELICYKNEVKETKLAQSMHECHDELCQFPYQFHSFIAYLCGRGYVGSHFQGTKFFQGTKLANSVLWSINH